MMPTKNRALSKLFVLLKKLLPWFFYAAIIVFLVVYLRGIDFHKLSGTHVSWWWLIAASVMGVASRFYGTFIWFVLLSSLGATGLSESKRQLVYVYAKSWLGRYIPGTVPWIAGKIYFASKHGISKNKLAVSSLLEGGLKIVVMLALGFMFLMFDTRVDVIPLRTRLLMAGLLVICIIAMLPDVFNRIVAIGYRLLKRKTFDQEHRASGRTIGKGALLYSLGTIVNGISFFFIAKAVYPALASSNAFFVMGAGNLSQAASMLAVFVPSGLGVREGIQLVLLRVVMPLEFALLIVVVTRLWSVLIDFIFFGLSWVYYRREE